MANNFLSPPDFPTVSEAVAHYWQTRLRQKNKQSVGGRADQGARSAVTGGAQMDGFIEHFKGAIFSTGMPESSIIAKKTLELPGYFRPTKEWDLLVVKGNQLIVAIETKSQVGPSFGNNFNNRAEEAMGNALDLWTAYREGAFNQAFPPFIGYFFMLEDCEESAKPVRIKQPHFRVFPEFIDASYAKRYELLCRKLVLERHYSATSFITSTRTNGLNGVYSEPAADLGVEQFAQRLTSQVVPHVQQR